MNQVLLAACAMFLPRGAEPLVRVAVEQRFRRLAPRHHGQLPAEVVRIVDPGVQPAHAEDWHQVRGVAGEQHPAVPVAVEGEAVGAVQRLPHHAPRGAHAHHVELRLQPRRDGLVAQRGLGVLVVAELVVDAPDVVRLNVQNHGGARVGRRVEPDVPLHRPVGALHLDVGDEVAAFVRRAAQRQAHQLAHRRAAAVGRDDPIRPQLAAAARPRYGEEDAVPVLLRAGDAPVPEDLTARRLERPEQEPLRVELLDVDEGRVAVVGRARHLQPEHEPVAVEGAPAGPGQGLGREGGPGAQAVEDFLAAARDADGAAAPSDLGLGFQHHRPQPVARQFDRRDQPHRPGAHHRDRGGAGPRHWRLPARAGRRRSPSRWRPATRNPPAGSPR
jgi:hypothetical protein